ncbi:MAG TPA: carboxypeptidase regulatory-like domain-containing protein [Candidatus Angelobacter sp.]|nr:carboxypeptidase regulatory-like domain-containing protein [Candidatus Angelobacter sp.]
MNIAESYGVIVRRFTSLAAARNASVVLLFVLAVARCYPQANVQGQWTALSTWPTRAIHTTLLPDGRVFFVSFYAESLQPHIWDPATNTFSPTAASAYELFCAGHTSLPDGRVFIAGGHIADYVGYPHAVIYDPSSNSFKTLPDMNEGRWYPTTTVLPNGDVLVVSGDVNANTNTNPLPQVYQFASNSWRSLTTAQLVQPLYPVMFVAPNGKIFSAGPNRQSRYLNTSGTGSWSNVAVMSVGRAYGPGVMYDVGKVLEVGGGDPPTATAEIIDLNAATPAWKATGSMHFARRQHNAVVLPDGKVFISGGSSAAGFDTSTSPVKPTEMWDPATGKFTVMASIAVYRGYHSTALLLPDGRVLSAGGNVGGPNAQIYSPPYLFNGARPTISSAPTSVGYGQTVFVGTPNATGITKVSWIHVGSTTHTFDMAQRFMHLNFAQATNGLNVTMPANANIAPPGYYMLFILNGSGVPSVAKIIRISSSGGSTGAITGTVTNTSGAPLLGASVTVGANSAVTAADGTWSIQNMAAGTVTVAASLSGYSSASESATITAGSTTTAGTLALAPVSPGSVSGTVVDSSGTGISGATVSADGLTVATSTTGAYTLANLPAGSVTITASATGFANGSQTVTVTAGSTVTAPPITLGSNSGSVSGTVKSSAGTAIASASVGFGGGSTTTSSTGTYSLTGVPAGTIQLVASATGFQSSTQNVTITGGANSTADFTLTASGSTGKVTGKITNAATGGAISGATVKWSGGSTTSSSTGVYTLSNVTAGTQQITASKTGYLAHTLSAAVTSGGTATLNVPIAAGGKISVKVLSASNAAVPTATVTIKGGSVATTVTGSTSTAGTFTTNWIPVGSYTITVAKTGHTTKSTTATVTAGATKAVTFTAF